jgi:hypothetical protein
MMMMIIIIIIITCSYDNIFLNISHFCHTIICSVCINQRKMFSSANVESYFVFVPHPRNKLHYN